MRKNTSDATSKNTPAGPSGKGQNQVENGQPPRRDEAAFSRAAGASPAPGAGGGAEAPGGQGSALGDLARSLAAARDVPAGLDKVERNLRGSIIDRRLWPDRRNIVVDGQRLNPDGSPVKPDASGLERRRGPGRRLSDFTRSAEEGEMTREQFLFLMAIDEFKKANDKAYPTWTDVLEVVRLLGYRKTQKSELNLRRAEDWFEQHDAPSNVRPQRWHERGRNPGAGSGTGGRSDAGGLAA